MGVTGTGEITTVAMNGDDASKGKKVTKDYYNWSLVRRFLNHRFIEHFLGR